MNSTELIREETRKLMRVPVLEIKDKVKTEMSQMFDEFEENKSSIATKLESLRAKLESEGKIVEWTVKRLSTPRFRECRIPINTVSALTDIPVSQLALYFLNGESNADQMIEYRLGNVCFMTDRED